MTIGLRITNEYGNTIIDSDYVNLQVIGNYNFTENAQMLQPLSKKVTTQPIGSRPVSPIALVRKKDATLSIAASVGEDVIYVWGRPGPPDELSMSDYEYLLLSPAPTNESTSNDSHGMAMYTSDGELSFTTQRSYFSILASGTYTRGTESSKEPAITSGNTILPAGVNMNDVWIYHTVMNPYSMECGLSWSRWDCFFELNKSTREISINKTAVDFGDEMQDCMGDYIFNNVGESKQGRWFAGIVV